MRTRSFRNVTFEQKATAGVLAFGALLVAGWLAADSLSSSGGGHATSTAAQTTILTVTRVRTVREPGRVVTLTHDVPVARRVVVRTRARPVTTTLVSTSTTLATRTIYRSGPSETQVVTTTAQPVTVTHLVTTVQWRVVTVSERPPTVTITVPGP